MDSLQKTINRGHSNREMEDQIKQHEDSVENMKREKRSLKLLKPAIGSVAKSLGFAFNRSFNSSGHNNYFAGFMYYEKSIKNAVVIFLEYSGIPYQRREGVSYNNDYCTITGIDIPGPIMQWAFYLKGGKKLKEVSPERKKELEEMLLKNFNCFSVRDLKNFNKKVKRAINSGKTFVHPPKGVYKGNKNIPTIEAMKKYNEILIGDITKMWFAKLILGIVIVVFLYNYFF